MPIDYPKPPFPSQKRQMPGLTELMHPRPDHGEMSYKGSGRLAGMKAVITVATAAPAAVAVAYARESADLLMAYLSENDEAEQLRKMFEAEPEGCFDAWRHHGSRPLPGADYERSRPAGWHRHLGQQCGAQATFKDIADISDEERDLTFAPISTPFSI